ncbi:phosphatidylserine/phosphatidylglycerophosphate/cardiolipin synthase-like enzyme [Nocardioides aurantiacus]|uniref:phospholipase D n=1 Tax=Nocardioides aurantiacus TaxID=86796 RepID=A0A3N2CWS0_9ACTN|nr:phosphatidylserine/phosphatidylglycerophosphate/cardiolipin synthase-like enzyme [Nocardioides aurantiacus]
MGLYVTAAALVLSATSLDAGAVASAVPAAAPGAAIATGDSFVPVAGPVFGDPTATRNEVVTRLLDNIGHTPAGATIRIVGYSFTLDDVATALLKAHARGVNVRIVLNGHSSAWSPAKRLIPVLGTDIDRRSFIVLTRGSARGSSGVNHQKSWTFSQVGRTPHVVMVGSTNLTGYGTTVQYSDMYVHTNRADVFGAYTGVFAAQMRDAPLPSPFVSTRFEKGGAYFFPAPGTTETTDPARQRIASLPDDASTTIAVAQYAWHDTRGVWLARALAAKKAAGATVVVVAGESVGAGVEGILRRAGIPIHSGVYADGTRIHTKLMFASYRTSTGQHTSIWTGSDNWADQSLRNDDTILQVDDDAAGYNQYVAFFNKLTRTTGAAPMSPVAVVEPPAVVTIRSATHSVGEDAGTVPLTVTREGNTRIAASARYALSSGTAVQGNDVVLAPGTVSFAPGETSKTLPLRIVGDVAPEAAETAGVVLSAPGRGVTLGATTRAEVVIEPSDQRPDAQVSTAPGSGYAGSNVYNSTGAGQARSLNARRNQARSFYARFQNDGNVTNTFSLTGSAAPRGATVRYYRGGRNVTAAMQSAAGLQVTLTSGALTTVRVSVHAHRNAKVRSLKPATVSARWTGDGTRTDVAKVVVRVVR